MEYGKDLFNEIWAIHVNAQNFPIRYHQLNSILERVVKELTLNFAADFTNFSARIRALCKIHAYAPTAIEMFRIHAQQIQTNKYQPNTVDYRYDLKALCEAIAAFFHEPIPEQLRRILPTHWRSLTHLPQSFMPTQRIRITVTHWDNTFLYGKDNAHPEQEESIVNYVESGNQFFYKLTEQLYEGAQVNLLSVTYRTESGQYVKPNYKGNEKIILYPELLVLYPDYLIDITAICRCLKSYGTTPYNYLLNKFAPIAKSAAIQMGNTANQFLDDCVNESSNEECDNENQLYLNSMMKSFRDFPLEYTTLEGIDEKFFSNTRMQFQHIRQTVKQKFSAADIDIEKKGVELEPSFLCEALGVQGRMDLLLQDLSKIVELKSGKANEWPTIAPQEEHALQMALYKEILFYNLNVPRKKIRTFLFYSRYPFFYDIAESQQKISEAIALRNSIVHLERMLRNGASEKIIEQITEKEININKKTDRFYLQYQRPEILRILTPLKTMDELEKVYFHTFLAFMQREHFLSKIGDGQIDSSRGFAEIWNATTAAKRIHGNILTQLTLQPISNKDGAIVKLKITIPGYDEDFLPNFRQGDTVLLYERNTENDKVTNKQIFRCVIESITPEQLLLKLSYQQRNASVFNPKKKYAIEPGYSDAPYHQAFRGLFALITAPQNRKNLLLGKRLPEIDRSITLNGKYLNPEIDHIVLQAKQAKDYFLLIGPPGTGKTSVALKSMVEEYLSDTPQKTLLLMAYTNRAVDEICEMLERITPQPDYIRIGQELSCETTYRPHLLKNRIKQATQRKKIVELLHPIRIITGTISSITGKMELFEFKRIDVALIDEASQVLEPQLLPLLCATTSLPSNNYNLQPLAIRKFILIGDHKQLPAVVLQHPSLSVTNHSLLRSIGLTDCRNSLFERLHNLQQLQQVSGITAMLNRQGRMHPAISEFVNQHFYGNNLGIVPVKHQKEELEFSYAGQNPLKKFVAENRIGFIAVSSDCYSENNKVNRNEAHAIALLVQCIYELCLHKNIVFHASRIGIIVPFRGQITMIKKELLALNIPECENITIDTVERYQGSQRDIILFSTTISQRYQLEVISNVVTTDGIKIDRKLNVALTRARKQFFIIGNEGLLRQNPIYRQLLCHIEAQGNSKFYFSDF